MTNPAFKPEFNEVRVDLHRLAAYVIAPARYRQTRTIRTASYTQRLRHPRI